VVGRLEGFEFHVDGGLKGEGARHLHTAARRALLREIPGRVKRFEQAEDGEFRLTDEARILWQDRPVARLVAGDRALKPRVEVFASDYLDGPQRERVRRRLVAWAEELIRARLGPLVALAEADLKGPARGIAFQLAEGLGLLGRRSAETGIAALSATDRQTLAKQGVEFGSQSLWYRGIGNGKSAKLAAQLWAVRHERPMPSLPAGRPLSFVPKADQPDGFCLALGYCPVAGLAVRSDALDRFARAAHQLGRQGAFLVTEPLRALVACDAAAVPGLLRALGYRQSGQGEEATFELRGRSPAVARREAPPAATAAGKGPAGAQASPQKARSPKPGEKTAKPARRRRKQGAGAVDPHSPFAALSSLRRRLRAGR
jgi:ATP-dependent RNA helicase SUPV3L1/SUV3